MSTESKRRLSLAIIDFLTTCSTDGTLSSDESESIEVAKQIIASAFEVDPTNSSAMKDALGGQSLLSIYGVFEKMKGKVASAAPSTSKQQQPQQTPQPEKSTGPTEAQIAEAEKLKGEGNNAMARKDFASAIELYTKALNLNPGNPIYLSNRAAAYSASNQHSLAVIDAQAAVDSDHKYTKAWSRLGLAKFALGDTKGAMLAYERGMAAEGAAPSEAMKRGYETAKRRLEEEQSGDAETSERGTHSPGARSPGGGIPDLSSLASMFGGDDRGGGPGGMDFDALLNNPMVAQMAQNVMKNPSMLSNLINNPRLKQMMEGAGGTGGLPDMASLMSDPTIAELAKNITGGGSGSNH